MSLGSVQCNAHQYLRAIVPRRSFQHLCLHTKNWGEDHSWLSITEVLQAHSGPSGSTFYSCPEKVQLGASALHSDIPVLFFCCAVTSVGTWGLNCNPLCYPPSGSTVEKLPSICSEAITNESALAQYVKTITECSLLLAVLVGAGSGGKAATWL